MNLFEPPTGERPTNAPVTLKRLGWGLSRGVLLGAGLAALLFAMAWAGALFESERQDPWAFFAWFIPLGALEFWVAAKAFASNRLFALLARLAAVALGVGSVIYLVTAASGLRLTDWAQAQPEFVTLVTVCGIVGLIAVRGGFRLWFHHRSRVGLWFAAAAALWFANEWSVKLGTVFDAWRDPRVEIAFNTVILAGVFAMTGVLALMDWHIRRRDDVGAQESASSEQNGWNNG